MFSFIGVPGFLLLPPEFIRPAYLGSLTTRPHRKVTPSPPVPHTHPNLPPPTPTRCTTLISFPLSLFRFLWNLPRIRLYSLLDKLWPESVKSFQNATIWGAMDFISRGRGWSFERLKKETTLTCSGQKWVVTSKQVVFTEQLWFNFALNTPPNYATGCWRLEELEVATDGFCLKVFR